MRLIDADAYIAEFEQMPMVQDAIRKSLEHMPTIEERKTGKWIHDGSKWKNRWICSECGHIWMFEPAAFCDKCGAVMIGGEECTKKI